MLQTDPRHTHDEAPLLPFDHSQSGARRGWRDVIAELLLALAVTLIAATGFDPLMLNVSQFLGTRAPRYDPVVWLLLAIPSIVALLVTLSIRLKISARRQGVAQHTDYAPTPYASALTWRRHIRQRI
jgi:hypothetical protein